jgi:hypothetical protein
LYVSTQRFEFFNHLVAGGGLCRFEGEPVDNVGHAAQGIVFIPRAGVDIDAYAGEVAREGFGGYADAIGEGSDLVEFGGVLYPNC